MTKKNEKGDNVSSRKWLSFAVSALVAVSFAACGSSNDDKSSSSASSGSKQGGTINGAGATFPAPVYAKWADAYNKATGVKVNYQSVGSGSIFAKSSVKKLYSQVTDADSALRVAVEALYDAADDDSATGGPDLVRGIFPTAVTIGPDGAVNVAEQRIAEVAHRLRGQPESADALLIALTGYGEAESRSRSAEAGFDFHMVKPADVDMLLALLANPQKARKARAA